MVVFISFGLPFILKLTPTTPSPAFFPTRISPTKGIVAIIEFNSTFGFEKEITVPYKESFDRSKYHYSNLCYGASLKAINNIMKKKGFIFIGTNLHRVNAFFVSKKYINKIGLRIPNNKDLKKYADSNIRESRTKNNLLSYLSGKKKIQIIKDCEIIDLSKKTPKRLKIKDIF